MNLCVYADKVHCTECKEVFYRNCKDFCRMHNLSLVKDIIPFDAKKVGEIPSKNVVVSRDLNRIKSLIAKVCINRNTPVKKLTLNQVLSVVLNKEEVEVGKVLYIECKQKPLSELEKVTTVLSGFVDSCSLKGTTIYIYNALAALKNPDWYQL